MKALILSAGKCSRLMPLTSTKHKCLIDIYDGTKIIDIELENLKKCGINDVIIVTGHFGFKIKEYVEKKFPEFNVIYVENKDYASTNCIYSLWLAREYLDDDIIYMTGDIIMDISVLQEILKAKDENIIFVNKELELPEKDFKARIQDGVVKKISEDVFGPDASFCLPLIKLSKKVVSNWLEKADELIKDGKVDVYETEALNGILEEIQLKPIYLTDFAMEVDDHKDLAIARARLTENKRRKHQSVLKN